MKNRNRTVFDVLSEKALVWAARTLLSSIPLIGPVFGVAFIVSDEKRSDAH
jgi:hypothetical protein